MQNGLKEQIIVIPNTNKLAVSLAYKDKSQKVRFLLRESLPKAVEKN